MENPSKGPARWWHYLWDSYDNWAAWSFTLKIYGAGGRGTFDPLPPKIWSQYWWIVLYPLPQKVFVLYGRTRRSVKLPSLDLRAGLPRRAGKNRENPLIRAWEKTKLFKKSHVHWRFDHVSVTNHWIIRDSSLTDFAAVTQRTAIVGGSAELPCNTAAPSISNPATLVIWYKNEGDAVYRWASGGWIFFTPESFRSCGSD